MRPLQIAQLSMTKHSSLPQNPTAGLAVCFKSLELYPDRGYNINYIVKESRLDIFKVVLTKHVKKDLVKVPLHIVTKLQAWIDDVENVGLSEVRKIPGYHDEPLKGNRVGQRSIRLSKSYRAIYAIDQEGLIELIKVLEVNKHEY